MSMDKSVPEIRFKEFSAEWKEEDFSSIVDIRSGRDYKHLGKGNIPVYGTGGYMLSVDGALSYDEDAIGIGRKGTIDKPSLLYAPFWTVDTLFHAVPYPSFKLDFSYCLFQNIDWKKHDESTGVPSLSKVAISNVAAFVTNDAEEQTQIGNYFQKLDEIITQHQQKHNKLLNIKKAMLEKMFPKAGATVPEIRFKGFSGEWKEKMLGKVGSFTSGVGFSEKEQSGKSGVPFFKVSDMNLKGNHYYMANANNYVNDEQILRLNYKPISEYSILFAKVGAAIFLERKRIAQRFLIDNNMMAFSPTQNRSFMKQWFDSIQLSKYTQVGALPSFKASDLELISIKFPNREEQNQIGNYFQKLDKLINQHQQQITKLKNIKQACLNKMFV